jgi:hypothetical protein
MRTEHIDRGLVVLLFAAWMLRIAAATLFPNIHHPDEIFQSLEPAFRSLNGIGIETWEWRTGIRSWIIPGLLRQMIAGFSALGASRDVVLALIAAVVSLFSLVIVWVGYQTGRAVFGREAGLAIGAACAIWPDLVLFAPKPMTEAIAADILILAAYWADKTARSNGPSRLSLAAIGGLLGLAIGVRFHIGFAVAMVAVWTCRTHYRSRWLPMAAGGTVALAAVGLIDALTWGLPFQSIWKNFWVNVVEGKSSSFGTDPPWDYVIDSFSLWGVSIAVILYGLWRGARHRPLFALTALAMWISLSAIPHKEMRFLFPSVPLLIIVAGLGCWELLDTRVTRFGKFTKTAIFVAACAVMSLSASTLFGFRHNWTRSREVMLLYRDLRARTDICGFGLVNVPWYVSGGYTHLHTAAPMYLMEKPAMQIGASDAGTGFSAFNYAITNGVGPLPHGYRLLRCIDETCLQTRDGGCSPDDTSELQIILNKTGQ